MDRQTLRDWVIIRFNERGPDGLINIRSLLLRLEHAHRPAVEDYVHRSSELGGCGLAILRVGISLRC